MKFKKRVLRAIHEIGGCDAADEWAKGYDDGINDAYKVVEELDEDPRIWQIANYYGFTSQADMLTEEAAEFTVALNKLRRGNTDAYDNIKEEVADVLVIALQLRELLGAERIDEIIHQKVDRQINRIQAENVWANEQLPNIIETPELTQRFITDFNKDKLTKEFWERKANEPPTDKCIIEEDWAEFGKLVQEGK